MVVYSEKFLLHETGQHPERKERLLQTVQFLQKNGISGFQEPGQIREKDLFLVHSEGLINELKARSKEKASLPDNIFNENTFEIALLAAGAGLKAAQLSSKNPAFSLARPPGHHAGKAFFGGFCYLNNVAIAVRAMQEKQGFGRAMIVDFDLHHGNGTQDIFYKDESVFYLSLHQDPATTFPGTGTVQENNAHIRNVPLPRGIGDKKYVEVFKKNFAECFDSFQPELLAVSAGFDIHESDARIVGSSLGIKESKTFWEIGNAINERVKGVPCFAVLEGGYSLNTLPVNVLDFLKAFD